MKKHIKTSHGIALLTACFFVAIVLITYATNKLDTFTTLSIDSNTQLAQISGSGSGLVAHYTFEGAADDSVGSSDGAESGGPTYATGRIGQAVQFDGVNDYVDLGQPTSLDMSSTNAFTLSAWVYPTGNTIVDSKAVFSRGRTGSSADTTVYGLTRYLFSPRWVAEVSDGTTKITAISSDGSLSLNQWQQVAVTWNGASKTLTIYKNANNIASATDAAFTTLWDGGGTGVNRNTAIGIVGRGKDLSSAFPGTLDDVRVYSRALSASEVSELYAYTGGSTPAPSDTTAPTTPTNLTATAVSSSQINISWSASTDAVGVTDYTIYRNGSLLRITSTPPHIDIGLDANTQYTYTVSASDAAGNVSAQTSGVSATTLDDTTAPIISSIQSSRITTTGATISWSTNESSDTQVEYGLTTGYGNTSSDYFRGYTNHSRSLTGLTANTTYHYRVKSTDLADNLTTSSDQTFTTSAVVIVEGTCSSKEQYGITWTFDPARPCGQFINGDWWVQAPVTIASVSPGWDGQRNGSMMDPVPYSTQSFDSRINAYYPFSEPNRVTFPRTIFSGSGTKSLVSSISLAQNKIGGAYDALQSAAVLTIVDTPPQADSFRPAFVSGTKKIWNKSEVNYGLVPNLPVPAGITPPNVSTIMSRPNLYFGHGVWGTTIIPTQNVSDVYPAYENIETSKLALVLMLNTSQKETYINRFIQRGIDHYSVSLQNREAWESNGGFGVGMKWPIVFAGILLNDAGMKSPPLYAPNIGNGSNYFKFPEDGYTYLGMPTAKYPGGKPLVGVDYAVRGYNIAICNSNCMARDPNGILDPEDRPNGGDYRQIFSPPWIGQALAVYLMNAKSIWNHDEYFAYADRWVSEPENWTDDSDDYKRNVYGYGDSSGFVRAMWNLYRNAGPITPPTTYTVTATKSGTGSGTLTATALSCTGNTCTATVNTSSSITITATPSAGSTFTGWSNGCTGTSTCTVSTTSSPIATFTSTSIPVNGLCSTTRNVCATGTFSDITDTNTNSLWSCTGSSGGTTASCSLPIADITPPVISVAGSTTTLPSDATSMSLVVTTNESATCKWGKVANTAYASLPNTFTRSVNTHTTTINSLVEGVNTVYVRCSDTLGNANTSDTSVTITVSSNSAPILNVIGNKSVNENVTLTFTVLASDIIDGDTLTYSTGSLPAGATFNTSTHAFAWTPSYTQAGSYNITFIVSDGKGGTDSEVITVTVVNTNRAPVANAGNTQTITLPISSLSLDSSGSSDPDGTAVTYLWSQTSGPNTAIFSSKTVARPVISSLIAGAYRFTLSVSDGLANAQDTVNITVNPTVVINTDSDGDLVPDSSDKCLDTPLALASTVNSQGCPKPKTTRFSTTDLTNVDLSAANSFDISNGSGQISYLDTGTPYTLIKNDGTQLDLDSTQNLNISSGIIFLNSAAMPQLNRPARLTFKNVNISNPALLRDGDICDTDCRFVSYANNTFIIDVPGFSTWQLVSAPIISNVAVSSITTSSATVSWTTDVATDSVVNYGSSTNYGSSARVASLTTSHSVSLSNLNSNSTYHYEISSTDGSGISSTDGDRTFTTTATNSGGGGGGGGGGKKPRTATISPVIPVLATIPGCGNRTTGFSTVGGQSCVGNTVTTNTNTSTPYNFGTVTLRNGSRGEAVMELQRFLNQVLNLGLVIDGKLGPKTIAVIKKWQLNNGLVADGLVGTKTKAKMNAVGR